MDEKNDLKKYRKHLDNQAKKFKITREDLSNLYDCFYMIDDDTHHAFKLNKMDKWFHNFLERVERIVVPELYKNERRKNNNGKK